VRRDVVYLGIERIVPHSEKSQSKSYSKFFSDSSGEGWEDSVKKTVGKILGKDYQKFRYASHSKYRLPIVESCGRVYSGFNMGAGENALFEIFSIMHSISKGALIVIDEIELGLHAEAQRKMVNELKELCKLRKLQIICTTHSPEIFNELPDDARLYIENQSGRVILTPAISVDYAFSKLSANNHADLNVLVEDVVAVSLLRAVLPSDIRCRVSIEAIGSASALARQLSSNYQREVKQNLLVCFDGDQRSREGINIAHAIKMIENPSTDVESWLKDRFMYLPGDKWPESWLLDECTKSASELSKLMCVHVERIPELAEAGYRAGKHNEFHEIGSQIGLEADDVLRHYCAVASFCLQSSFSSIIALIRQKIP
jgi:hypothetical protein